MKPIYTSCLAIILITTLAALAQDGSNPQPTPPNGLPERQEHGPGPGMRRGPGHRPPPPVIVALDANRDGVIDGAELANATQALLQLDANQDGQLTHDELRPPHHGGPEGCPPPRD